MGAPCIHGELLMLGIGIGPVDGSKVHGAEAATTFVTELKHFPAAIRTPLLDRPVRGADGVFQIVRRAGVFKSRV
jgi:hypothetical protein